MPNQTYLSLKEAAKKHNVEEKVLTQLISAGIIEAVEENGETFVAVDKNGNGDNGRKSQTKEEIITAKFIHLEGQPITLSEAAEKYDIPRGTIESWYYRAKYIQPIPPDSYPANFDEAEVAYLADIYHSRKKTGSRAPLLDKDGLPYELKHPDLAQYRRKKNTNPLSDE
jgi:hypothetical protein